MDILQDQLDHKSLQLDIVELLTAMRRKLQLDHGFCSVEMKTKIYLNIFARSRNLLKAVAELMKVFGDDFWMQTIKLISTNTGDNFNLPFFITKVQSVEEINCNPSTITKIILSYAHTVVPNEAVRIFVELMRSARDERKSSVLLDFGCILERCASNEEAFVHALKIFDIARSSLMVECFKRNAPKLEAIIVWMSIGYLNFENPASLHNIIAAFKQLHKVDEEKVMFFVSTLFSKFYVDYKSVVLSQNDSATPTQMKSVEKLTILLEESSFIIIPSTSLEFFNRLSLKMLSRMNHTLAPICIRLHTNFVKNLWFRMASRGSFLDMETGLSNLPFDDSELAKGIENFMLQVGDIVWQQQEEFEEFQYPLCSFMDLCICFQPSMKANHEHAIFELWSYKLTANTVEQLAGIVERQVFQKSNASSGAGFHRARILQSWSSLCKNYKTLPKTQASKVIISHLSLKSPFKKELECILQSLQRHDNMFEKTVAIAILDLSNVGNFRTLRSFIRAIEFFLREHIRGKSSVVVAIWSNVLRKLKSNVDSYEKAEEGSTQSA